MIDLRLALRSLLKTPLVSGAAVLSLALGMGANAAIFSIFEAMVLRPLPVQKPEELVNLVGPGPKSGSLSSGSAGDSDSVFSYPMFRDLENEQTVFTGIAGHVGFGANLAHDGNTISGEGLLVSGSYFEVLGLRPALGRLFTNDDDLTPGAHPLVVLSHAFWRSQFDGDPLLLNTSIVVNGNPMTIVGVAPRGFLGTTLGSKPDVFVPVSMRQQVIPGWEGFDDRKSYWIYLFARLAPGTGVDQASAAMNTLYGSILREVEVPLQEGMRESTLAQFAEKQLVLEPGQHGQSTLQGEVRAPLLLLLGVTGLVLLIACANIANLLLARATNRAGEIAIRLSIGAQRKQIVAQLLTESFLLATFGALLGLLVARGALALFLRLLPPEATTALQVDLGATVWLFMAALTLVTGLVGLFPALHATRPDLANAIKSQPGKASSSRGARRFRQSMVTFQIAMSMALLISAGLFTRSLVNATRVDLGIDVDQLVTFGVSPELNAYTPAESKTFFERLETELQAVPGVTGVAASMVPMIAGSNWMNNVTVQGFEAEPDADTVSSFNMVGPGYFRTVGIPLISGREFEPRDTLEAPEVAIVNEAFARKFGLDRDAVGKFMQSGRSDELDIEIVGLVADANYSDVKQEAPAVYFRPYRQSDDIGAINFYVRATGSPEQLVPAIRETVSRLDPNLPVEELRTMDAQVAEMLTLERVLSRLSGAFALLATVLAAVGIYGVVAYAVAQRRREIGLRMALGADGRRVGRMILRSVAWTALPGALIGILLALAVGRVAGSLLFEIEAHDPGVYVVAVGLLLLITFGAGLVPARRAAAIDPMDALREE